MKRRILAVLLTVCMLATMLPQMVLLVDAEQSESDIPYPVVGGNIYFNKATGSVTDSDPDVAVADIPDEIDGVSVNFIDSYAFENCTALTSVIVHKSLKGISGLAFVGCTELTGIWVDEENPNLSSDQFGVLFNKDKSTLRQAPCAISGDYAVQDSVTYISEYAFYGCSNLLNVTIPKATTSIGYQAFNACSNLKGIWVDSNNPRYVSDSCGVLYVKNKSGLVQAPGGISGQYIIPASVEHIGPFSFAACKELETVTFSKTNKNVIINESAFSDCMSLTNVTLSDTTVDIFDNAFSNCVSLKSITVPKTRLGDEVFAGCTALQSVVFDDQVVDIGKGTFKDCKSLTNVKLPKQISKINDYEFCGCTGLETIVIPNKAAYIGASAFDGCIGLKDIVLPTGGAHIGAYAFRNCIGLTSVKIPAGVSSLDDGAFQDCINLTAAFFYGNAPYVGRNAFKTYDTESETYVNIPDLTLYYIEGRTAWRTPVWQGYPTAIWNGKACSALCSSMQFVDAPEPNNWAHNAVDFVLENDIFAGVDDTHFNPNGKTTRAMFVAVLWRMDGRPESQAENPFTDVKDADYFAQAVTWAADNNIVFGVDDSHFNPGGYVTREEAAAFLYRFANLKGYSLEATADLSKFPDANKASEYAMENLSWAVGSGLISGTAENGAVYLAPRGNATRAQVAQILMKFMQNVVDGSKNL